MANHNVEDVTVKILERTERGVSVQHAYRPDVKAWFRLAHVALRSCGGGKHVLTGFARELQEKGFL
jgi:hypothetical protein